MLKELTEFIFKHSKMMDFSTEPPDLRVSICNAVLNKSTQEYKIFRRNLDELIEKNI